MGVSGEKSADADEGLANFLRATNRELEDFARPTGSDNVHKLPLDDLCTVNTEISGHTGIEHA